MPKEIAPEGGAAWLVLWMIACLIIGFIALALYLPLRGGILLCRALIRVRKAACAGAILNAIGVTEWAGFGPDFSEATGILPI